MARKPRLEFAGALYHVISRGNYRKPIFEDGGGRAFERTLFEAAEKCGWRLHAYVVMDNHYHLALETPKPNLVEGMRWLQGTYGIRFNAFRRERGHVFQSRYKSLLVEEGRSLLGLVNYIHLNPVRAGLVELRALPSYALSSYPKFFEQSSPRALERERFLATLEFPNTPSGMQRYAEHLQIAEEADMSAREELTRRYCRGWAVASREYREGIKATLAKQVNDNVPSGPELAEIKEHHWSAQLTNLLVGEGRTRAEAAIYPKSASWKIRIAAQLRTDTTASNAWIARELAMGHPTRVCNLLRQTRGASF